MAETLKYQSDSDTFKDASDDEQPSDNTPKSKKRGYGDIPDNSASVKRPKSELYKPPTVEELNSLKETEQLYNNNLFRLQIEEILPKVCIKKKRTKLIEKWMNCFEQFVSTLPEYTVQLSDIKQVRNPKRKVEKLINELSQHVCPLKCDQDVALRFVKPVSIEQFGLYKNNSQLDARVIVTINLVMPKTCFHQKDYLNNRYLIKKYYYLLFLMKSLQNTEFISNISMTYFEQNFLLPVLIIEPMKPVTETKVLIMIFVTPEDDTFKPSRFLPHQNNIKQNTFKLYKIRQKDQTNPPTVLYNNTLAFDITLSKNNCFISEILKDSKNLQDGIKLLSIWLKQRELNVILGGLTETLVMYFVVYLFEKKKINKYMSSYQVIRNFWSFIKTSDLKNNPISLGDTHAFEEFKKYFDVIFLDVTGCHNLTGFMDLETYKKFQHESGLALKLLDNGKSNSFHEIFFIGYPFHIQYDVVIDIIQPFKSDEYDNLSETDIPTFFGYAHLLHLGNILKPIKRSLRKRYLYLTSKIKTEHNHVKGITIGINLNPDEAFSVLEIGPALNDVAAEEFREFWGHLASNRRFRDGSTNVAVYFKTNTISSKRRIVKRILEYILNEKLNLQYKMFYDEFEEVIVNKMVVPTYPSGTNEETTLKAIRASDELGKKMRALQMSLKVTGIQGTSDVFSYSMAFPQIPTNYEAEKNVTTANGDSLQFLDKQVRSMPRYVQAITSVIQLELSSKWPTDLQALRNVKAAFYLEISKNLRTSHNIMSRVTMDYVEVMYKGFMFRYYLYVPREVGLIKMTRNASGLYSFSESEHSIEMEKSLDIVPKMMGAIKGVQSLYPSFGPGTALIKRWIRAQLIDDFFFSDIVINLLNASLYLNEVSIPVNTPQASFLRFLNFFSHFDWNTQCVVVDFNNDITLSELGEIESKLQKNRSAWPLLYIITTIDQGFSIFTGKYPTKEILFRIKNLAKESLKFVENMFLKDSHITIKNLFTPNYDGYNVLIYLNQSLNPRRHEEVLFGPVEGRTIVEEYKENKSTKIPIVDFNPVDKYLMSLRKNYGKYALFFHNPYGGNLIGVLWYPQTHESVDFKVSRVNGMKLENEKLHFNVDAVIEDFFTLGVGLVKGIENKRS